MEIMNMVAGNKWRLVVLGIGLIFLGFGVWQMISASKGDEVVVTEVGDVAAQDMTVVVVDMAGAVEKPGVYKMSGDIRVGDVLIAAGGLSATADRGYVARFINQAQKVTDGMKIYIPEEGDPTFNSGETGINSRAGSPNVAGAGVINVNTATLSQLDALTGVGEARAKAIIDNRPYSSLEELVSKAKMPQGVLDNNEGKISVY